MKKTLKVIASAAVAMSAFASVAMADDAATTTTSTTTGTSATTAPATKTSADFKDLANVDAGLKAKIDALLKAGVFEGTAADQFGINENMTRAQFAKVLDLIYGVNVDASVKTSSFSDVKADDQANGWAIPYIEAAKKAGLIDGVSDTTFVPGDNVTLGQFATALVKGLGVKPDMTGTPWYADAVKQAIAKNVLPADTDGSKLATRADLVVGAYGGQQAFADINKPAQVSVASVKAVGVKTVQVNFDRDVDTSKATLALTRGTVSVATTVKFADDKKSATLTLTDTSLMAGDYTVTLGGLDASAIKTATGTFTAQDEVIQKIEFVTASDTIAKATNVLVKIKATNQYGEMASVAAGSYSFYGATKLTKNSDGYLLATVDTSSATSGVGIVTVTVISNDSGHVTATKNFTVGTEPILSKLELGNATYSNGTGISGTGDNAKFALNLYDQYGSMMGFDSLNLGGTNEKKPTVIWNDYLDGATSTTEDDGNNNPILKISLSKNIDKSGDYKFTVIDQAASATSKVTIQSAKVATKIQIGSLDDVIAAGDKDVYIPVIAYDAAGNQLTADELVNTDNYTRISISTNATSANGNRLEPTGEHKGQIHLTTITGAKNGAVSVSAFIATANVSSNDSKNFTVQAARIPDHIKEVTAPGKQITPGGSTKFKYAIIDQYGKQLDSLQQVDSQGNVVTSGGAVYTVTVAANTYAPQYDSSKVFTGYSATPMATVGDINGVTGSLLTTATPMLVINDADAVPNKVALIGSVPYYLPTTDLKTNLNGKTFRFAALNDTNSKNYKTTLVVTVFKDLQNGKGAQELTKLTRDVTVADVANATLTYSLNSVATLWNAKDSGVVTSAVYDNGGSLNGDSDALNVIGKTTQLSANSKFGREVTISAKNAAGEVVGLPKQIVAISSSNTNVVNVLQTTDANGIGKGFVIGNKAGTASIAVSFIAADNSTKTLTTDITVKNDALNVAKVTWDDQAYDDGFTFSAFKNVNVTDNYGVTYEDADAQKYNYALGVAFAVSGMTDADKAKYNVLVDKYGNVTITHKDGSAVVAGETVTFDLTATSATGKSATTTIHANSSLGNYSANRKVH